MSLSVQTERLGDMITSLLTALLVILGVVLMAALAIVPLLLDHEAEAEVQPVRAARRPPSRPARPLRVGQRPTALAWRG